MYHCQEQDSDCVLASYQDETRSHNTPPYQPLVSTMGKLHYKGKENLMKHPAKFPNTYG